MLRSGHGMVDLWLACPKCGDKNPIMVEVRGQYDGGLYWLCNFDHDGDGAFAWHRWPNGHYLNHRAQQFIDQVNAQEVHDRGK